MPRLEYRCRKYLTVDQGRQTRLDTVDMTPKITKTAMIMPFSTLLISLRFPSIFVFVLWKLHHLGLQHSSDFFSVWEWWLWWRSGITGEGE